MGDSKLHSTNTQIKTIIQLPPQSEHTTSFEYSCQLILPSEFEAIYHTPTMTVGSQDSGATGAAKWVTSTLGNTVGGVTRTVGGVTGAATRGVGDTINSATGSAGRPVGDAIGNAGTGLEDGTKSVAKGVENAGQWKGQWR